MSIEENINFDVNGKVLDSVYYRINGVLTKRAYFIPVQPGTPDQLAWWEIFRDGVKNYQLLSDQEKADLRKQATPLGMEGFNLFMSNWLKGEFDMISKILNDTYIGDNTDNRIIDLGDDYDEVHIYLETDKNFDVMHLCEAYALGLTHGIFNEENEIEKTVHRSGSPGDFLFQGKMFTPGDETKIMLGSNGASARGTNNTGWVYRIVAKKYRVSHNLP